MADRFTPEERSRIMAKVKGRDTKPEILVRRILHRLGYRFRLYRKDLPGKPDIVLPRHRKIIFVHGCFWHGHDCKRGARPETNADFWNAKITGNKERDARNREELKRLGWDVLTLWVCEMKDPDELAERLGRFIEQP